MDPVAALIIAGEADTVERAEELYLDRSVGALLALVSSDLSDDDFRAHPLVQLLLARGSRGWEGALD